MDITVEIDSDEVLKNMELYDILHELAYLYTPNNSKLDLSEIVEVCTYIITEGEMR